MRYLHLKANYGSGQQKILQWLIGGQGLAVEIKKTEWILPIVVLIALGVLLYMITNGANIYYA